MSKFISNIAKYTSSPRNRPNFFSLSLCHYSPTFAINSIDREPQKSSDHRPDEGGAITGLSRFSTLLNIVLNLCC